MQWMIYGANGYTGKLIAREAVRRGLKPVLAGRNRDEVEALGKELDLPVRVFGLDNRADLLAGLADMRLVLHCAGPFSATAEPMMRAAIDSRCHYLDITGEIDVFALGHSLDERARAAGIVLLPGAGFDVVPTDCLAALLKDRLPDSTHLVLAFEAGGGPSPGTAKTSVEGLGKGGRARIDGKLSKVPLAWKVRFFERDGEQRLAMTIPWGDVYTSFVSTAIPNVEVYMAVPPATVKRLRRLRWLGPLLGSAPVQKALKAQVAKKVRGPSPDTRGRTGCTVWGEASNALGQQQRLRLITPNGYELTVTASLGIVDKLLEEPTIEGGYYTPSLLMGREYVLSLPGVVLT
jgi:short subunit dehydrogenase-like uncharacterized protein